MKRILILLPFILICQRSLSLSIWDFTWSRIFFFCSSIVILTIVFKRIVFETILVQYRWERGESRIISDYRIRELNFSKSKISLIEILVSMVLLISMFHIFFFPLFHFSWPSILSTDQILLSFHSRLINFGNIAWQQSLINDNNIMNYFIVSAYIWWSIIPFAMKLREQ